ncbi:MAG: ATP-binding protein [Promethearchaeota archaeon]
MKELAIVSGKGGTGKTTITASLAVLATNHVVADCDVDAPNLHLLLNPKIESTEEFANARIASIDPELCTKCGACISACRFEAISEAMDVNPLKCEGCGVCALVCPASAVQMNDRLSGYVYLSKTSFCPMAHALLMPGESNSGKLVTLVRQRARELASEKGKDLVLVDGPPGIACSTIATITGVAAGLVVAEPTIPAFHDLERTLELFNHFGILAMVVINKCDLNSKKTEEIERHCIEHDIKIAGRIPYDLIMTNASVAGNPVVVHAPKHALSMALRSIWNNIKSQLA